MHLSLRSLIKSIEQFTHSYWDFGQKSSLLYLWISRSMEVVPLTYPGQIISTYEHVKICQEVLLLQQSWGAYLWWAQHGGYLVGYRREFLPASMLVPDIFLLSQNFPRRMISHIVICLFTFGSIKALLPDACPSIQWSCVLHGSHVEFEMDLEMVVVFWLDICLWWIIGDIFNSPGIPKLNLSYRLSIPRILQAAHLLRLRNLHISSETYTRRFWRSYSNHWDTAHMVAMPIAVQMELVESSILAS